MLNESQHYTGLLSANAHCVADILDALITKDFWALFLFVYAKIKLLKEFSNNAQALDDG